MPLSEGTVIAQRSIANDYYEISFTWPAALPAPVPGQFVTVRVTEAAVPLLRRPFGISAFEPSQAPGSEHTASMIYWKRGPATNLMAAYEPGDTIRVMGPLGKGFPAPAPDSRPVLVAGGVGIGPIWYLATELARRLGHQVPTLITGARTASGLPALEPPPGVTLLCATDDGSAGRQGTAIDLLGEVVENASVQPEIFLCGPHGMLRAGHMLAATHGFTAWVSMEQTMGCAVGACMGCVVETVADAGRAQTEGQVTPTDRGTSGPHYARVCTEGPVFRSTEVVW